MRCKHVFECYRPEPAATVVGSLGPPCLDGADAFLLQTLGDYSRAAAVAIRQRWEQIRVAQLPAILLASDSFAGFISLLDVEIFMYDDANASRVLWVYDDREIAANMDK